MLILKLNKKKKSLSKTLTFKTMSGDIGIIKGVAFLKLEILIIEKKLVFIVDKKDFRYDFFRSLDIIMEFRLSKHCNRERSQDILEENILKVKNTKYAKTDSSTEKFSEVKINWNVYMPIEKIGIEMKHFNENKKNEIFNLIEKYNTVFAKISFISTR